MLFRCELWDSDVVLLCSVPFYFLYSVFISLYFFIFSLLISSSVVFFFLNHKISGFWPSISRQSIKWVSMLNFRKSKIFGTLHLVSEHMVKRQPWFCWVLLIRDRVSSTLEWVECNNSYESVFVSEYIKLFCIVMIGLLSGIWTFVSVVRKTMPKGFLNTWIEQFGTILILNWVNGMILPWVYFYI